ncbi:MAG: hypothetical protein HRU25_17340 [Psychrobium sp.]|nr:hypothetical protein [Psychrobium sp.]
MNSKHIGLGMHSALIAVHIDKRPPMVEYGALSSINALVPGEIHAIGQHCGNGWRKVFNIYAKLLVTLDNPVYLAAKNTKTWQNFRDEFLLQGTSNSSLMFSEPHIVTPTYQIRLIMGKAYAKALLKTSLRDAAFDWLDDDFAIDLQHHMIICPYFDYRQLSDIKILRLSHLINSLINARPEE